MAAVELRNLALGYHGSVILSGVNLSITRGETVAVVGPSGCGKSSLLRCVAGFLDPTSGSLHVDGECIADARMSVPPEQRRVGFVFQQYALWPHMTARENVAYPWRTRRVGAAERARLAEDLLDQVGLKGFEDRLPGSLSGGQQQRVALARGLAGEPRLLLLDEPLSSVDAALRDELQTLISDIVGARQLTTIITTHDQREATALADRIVVLGDGGIAQCATPVDLNEHPANAFVARFMGALNVFEVEIVRQSNDRLVATLADGSGELIARTDEPVTGGYAVLIARPETVRITSSREGDQEGTVMRSVLNDGRNELRVRLDSGVALRVFEAADHLRAVGDRVGLILEHCRLIITPNGGAPVAR